MIVVVILVVVTGVIVFVIIFEALFMVSGETIAIMVICVVKIFLFGRAIFSPEG